MVILRLKADGTTAYETINLTEQEETALFGLIPTTLQEKIDNLPDIPELNEILAELVDVEEESEET